MKRKHHTPEREFGFVEEPYRLLGDTYQAAAATIARNEEHGEQACFFTKAESGKQKAAPCSETEIWFCECDYLPVNHIYIGSGFSGTPLCSCGAQFVKRESPNEKLTYSRPTTTDEHED